MTSRPVSEFIQKNGVPYEDRATHTVVRRREPINLTRTAASAPEQTSPEFLSHGLVGILDSNSQVSIKCSENVSLENGIPHTNRVYNVAARSSLKNGPKEYAKYILEDPNVSAVRTKISTRTQKLAPRQNRAMNKAYAREPAVRKRMFRPKVRTGCMTCKCATLRLCFALSLRILLQLELRLTLTT